MGYYTACSGNVFPAFRGNLTIPSSVVKSPGIFYCCTVHFVVYLSNTPRNAHILSLII